MILTDCDDSPMAQRQNFEISAQQQAQIKEIFDLFDTDGGGTIERSELDAAMFVLGLSKCKGQEISKGQAMSGTSESVTLKEFTSMMKGEMIGHAPIEEIWAAFATMSQTDSDPEDPIDGWGKVTLDGLRRTCQKYDVRLSEDELQFMMSETDLDSDGFVDKTEFIRIMDRSPWF